MFLSHRAPKSTQVSKDEWGDASGEVVMDVGCGDGANSSKRIITHFPKVDKIIALDRIAEVIDIAREKNVHPKIEYCVADIEDKSSLTHWENKMDRVFSFHCFNYVKDQRTAFENVFRMLKSGGKAEVVFRLQSSYFDALDVIKDKPKWKQFFKHAIFPQTSVKKTNSAYYRNLLESVGFSVVYCAERTDARYFSSSDRYFKEMATSSPWYQKIPMELRKEYERDLFQAFEKHSLQSIGFLPCFTECNMEIYIRKL